MSFGRWLLIHSFSIFVVAVFIIGYAFRAELQLEQVYNQLLNIDPKSVSITSRPKTPPVIQQEVHEAESQNPGNLAEKKHQLTEAGTSISATKPTVSDTRPRPQPTMAAATVKQEDVPVMIPAHALDLQEQLFLARKAYWDKNYADAIAAYQSLIQKDRSNPDYRGELGNIYYALNDNENASKLYYQAAMLFLQQNRPEQARLLLSPVLAMNRELGEDLKMKINH